MRAQTGFSAFLVYLGIRAVFAMLEVFPIHWNLRTARMLARLWPFLMPRHRDRAIAHLRLAYGNELSDRETRRIANRCLENAAMFAVEAVCLPRLINAFTWSRYIELEDFDDALRVILAGQGAILVTGHYGSFEISGHLLAALGQDTVAVMRPLDNAYLNSFIVRSRRRHGLRLLDKKGASAQAQAMLEDGYLLGFIGDQDAGRKGIFVDFFGQPASAYKSIGLLAMVTRRPIIVGYARRLGTIARYAVGVSRIIKPDEWENRDDPLRWITQTYTAAIEKMVREAPEQYLWIHRRWKSQPRNAPRSTSDGVRSSQRTRTMTTPTV
jgi:KDO2-lipid IV(A) lauroyltransferase